MSRIVALDFDLQTAQVVVVERRATGTTVRHAAQFSLAEDAAASAPEKLAESVKRELGSLKLASAKAVILVGGDDVQYRLVDLPPAPADDLPDMVRFQSVREFAAADEDAALDFIPLRGDASTPHQVLAARLRSTTEERARLLCDELDVELARIVPRGVSLASACKRLMPELSTGKHLIAAPVGNQLEMVLLRDGEVILLRRARVSGEQTSVAAVLGELRRTVTAAAAQLEGPVDSAIHIGERLPEDVRVEATSWKQFASLDLTRLLREWSINDAMAPAESARLAPVLEAALMEADRTAPALDFANPRQRIVVETPKRTRILAGIAAATVVLAIGVYLFGQLLSLDRETNRFNADAADKHTTLEQYESFVERADAIERWLATDVAWLDEIDRTTLALRPKALDDLEYPADQDVIVKQLRTRRPDLRAATGGVLELETTARNSAALDPLETRLRDARHDVQPGKLGREPTGGEYPLAVRYDVTIRPPDASRQGAAQ